MRRYLYIVLGTISLALGLIGIVLPGLPTTPFILLTAYLYMRSSPRLYKKLHENKITGRYLKKMSGGLSLKGRLISIGIMWVMICISAFAVFEHGTMRFVMLGLGVIGTIAQLIVLRKRNKETSEIVKTEENLNSENTDL